MEREKVYIYILRMEPPCMNRAVSSPFLAVWLVRGAWTPLVCIAAPREFYNFIERKGVGVPRIASRRGTIKRDNHRRLFSRNELMNRAERRICLYFADGLVSKGGVRGGSIRSVRIETVIIDEFARWMGIQWQETYAHRLVNNVTVSLSG